MSIRVRFAPSPTGSLHIGGARTALFNWLFARRENGVFILRIEDTDVQRSSDEMTAGILDGLRWLGLDWDEGPFYQSERMGLYQEVCQRLLTEGHAYRDFSPAGSEPGAYKNYRDLDRDQAKARENAGEPFALRFKVPEGVVVRFDDTVFGGIEVRSESIEDFVLRRSDGLPTYHLSVVADDIDMAITHVIRGADHLSNTSKHILIYQALGEEIPAYAHLPLILGTDKKRLSKRHGATSVSEYAQMGLLPDAVRNYIALLGWSPGADEEILPGQLLIDRFDLRRVNKANAVFDPSKVEWMNKRYLSSLEAVALESDVRRELAAAGFWNDTWESGEPRRWFLGVIALLKSRVENLKDFAVYGRPFFCDEFEYETEAEARYLSVLDTESRERLKQSLLELREEYARLSPFSLQSTEETLRRIAAEYNLKAGLFIGTVRTAMTGRSRAPGIFDVLVALGKEKTVERLDRLIGYLS